MSKTRPAYSPEFRRQIVELARARRDPADLVRKLAPSSQEIRSWIPQTVQQEGEPRGENLECALGSGRATAAVLTVCRAC